MPRGAARRSPPGTRRARPSSVRASSTGRSPVPAHPLEHRARLLRLGDRGRAGTSSPTRRPRVRHSRAARRRPRAARPPGARAPVASRSAVRVVPGTVAHERVRRGVDVARHLHRQPAAGGQGRRPPRQEVEVAGHPLQGGVGDDDVGRRRRARPDPIAPHRIPPTRPARRGPATAPRRASAASGRPRRSARRASARPATASAGRCHTRGRRRGPGASAPTRAIRSPNGRDRWSENLAYCCGIPRGAHVCRPLDDSDYLDIKILDGG